MTTLMNLIKMEWFDLEICIRRKLSFALFRQKDMQCKTVISKIRDQTLNADNDDKEHKIKFPLMVFTLSSILFFQSGNAKESLCSTELFYKRPGDKLNITCIYNDTLDVEIHFWHNCTGNMSTFYHNRSFSHDYANYSSQELKGNTLIASIQITTETVGCYSCMNMSNVFNNYYSDRIEARLLHYPLIIVSGAKYNKNDTVTVTESTETLLTCKLPVGIASGNISWILGHEVLHEDVFVNESNYPLILNRNLNDTAMVCSIQHFCLHDALNESYPLNVQYKDNSVFMKGLLVYLVIGSAIALIFATLNKVVSCWIIGLFKRHRITLRTNRRNDEHSDQSNVPEIVTFHNISDDIDDTNNANVPNRYTGIAL